MGGEEEGRVTGKRDREGETGAEGRASEAGGTKTADELEGRALESKEKGCGAGYGSSEKVESGAG